MASQNLENRLKEVCAQCAQSFPEGTRVCPYDGSELIAVAADPMIGVILPRRYRILEALGRGSMSVVYKGTYEPLDQFVAIKMLKSHLVADPHSERRFQQEIRAAGSLNNPNIVGILDFGVTEQGVPYLIMEYLDGKSLGQVLERVKRISSSRAIDLISQAAQGLAYAHSEGVIHRDLKPTNLMLTRAEDDREILKIVDFGIAKIQHGDMRISAQKLPSLQAPPGLSDTGELLGTPLYMSPEQCQGLEMDGRSDIYSLGCVLYQCLVGRPPFVGNTVMETIRMQINATAESIEHARPDLFFPERLQEIVMRCLAKDPRMRYQRMEHLAADLEACEQKPGTRRNTSSTNIERAPQILEESHQITINLPVLCGILAVVSIIVVATWGFLTDIGKKSPSLKLNLPIANDSAWKKACADGQTAFASGNYGQAETAFFEAIDEAKKFPQPDARVAQTLNNLACVYDAQDKIEDAKKSSTDALAVAQELKPANDGLKADTLTNLCRIDCELGDYGGARRYGDEALTLNQQGGTARRAGTALTLQALAQVSCKSNDYEKADKQLTEALLLAEKSLGEESPEIASVLNDLGMVREKEGNYKAADDLLKRALGIRQRHLGMQHPATADTLCTLGTLNFNMNNDTDAEKYFKDALAIRQSAFGEESSRTAEVYSCLAILYDNQHKFDQAEDCYRKALDIRQAVWGAESPKLVRSLQSLAKFLREHNQPSGAEVYEAQLKRIEGQTKS